jgi:hypothetical protein
LKMSKVRVLLTVVIVQTFQVLKVTVGEITWKMAETLIGAFLANLAIDSPIGKKDSMEQLQYFTMYCCRHSLMQFSWRYFWPGRVSDDFDSSAWGRNFQ